MCVYEISARSCALKLTLSHITAPMEIHHPANMHSRQSSLAAVRGMHGLIAHFAYR